MIILLVFSFLAGIATVLSPCIIPILPAVLSGGIQQGRFRPIGIILGLILSFSFFTLTLSAIVRATGISPDVVRYIGIGAIALFGLIMLVPKLSDLFSQLTAFAASAGNSLQMKTNTSTAHGFGSGFLLGISLGLIWTPCAGPILASVTTLALTGNVNLAAIFLTLAYSLGAGLPLLFIAYGGNRVANSSRSFAKHAERIRQLFGVLMILTAIGIAFGIDRSLQLITIRYFSGLQPDTNARVSEELQKLKQQGTFSLPTLPGTNRLSDYGKAPELTGITGWINTEPLTLASLRGKVVLVDFWTYSCINCIRTFPYLTRWYETYKDKGFVIVGIHTPEFEFEKSRDNVIDATKRFAITYPVAQDNQYATWNAYSNQYWPAHYLIDKEGTIRMVHFGEGKYEETENAIRTLLDEEPMEVTSQQSIRKPLTPETYLGYQRAQGYVPQMRIQRDTATTYTTPSVLYEDSVGLEGTWSIGSEQIRCVSNCRIHMNFLASKVFLVLSGSTKEPIDVFLDGKTTPSAYRTKDYSSTGVIQFDMDRAYDLIDLGKDYGRHTVTINIPTGLSAYAFTFGE